MKRSSRGDKKEGVKAEKEEEEVERPAGQKHEASVPVVKCQTSRGGERGAGLTLVSLQLICRLFRFELPGQHGDRHPGVQQACVQRRNPGQETEAPCRV